MIQLEVESTKDIFSNLKDLWLSVLRNDKEWHFFYEGLVIYLRVPDHLESQVLDFLKAQKCKVVDRKPYVENIKTSVKYLKQFVPLFHYYSELAMVIDPKDLDDVFDRVYHTFLNMTRSEGQIDRLEPFCFNRHEAIKLWESMVLSKAAAARAYTIGYYTGLQKALEENGKDQ
jgi:hypothetical protein